MQGIDFIFYLFVAICSCYCILDWRRGVYLALLIDVVRDPVRKLAPDESILLTLSGTVVWAAVVIGAWMSNYRQLPVIFRVYPSMRRIFVWMIAAMLPGAALSCLLYSQGVLIASIGALSYLGPLLGLLVGVFFLREEREVRRLLVFFCIVNSIALIFSVAEYRGYDWPVLGGLKGMEWKRYRPGYIVNLISGIYRSPDIMGLHAAHVMMFSIFLAMLRSTKYRPVWWGVAAWAGVNLLLCGRRKMIGIPLVFVLSWVLLTWYLDRGRGSKLAMPLLILFVVIMGGMAVFSSQLDVSADYSEYAVSTFSEGGDRLRSNVLESTYTTLQQHGMLGAGLGVCTQGRYYLGDSTGVRAWQEDGVSRLFIELGVPGVVFIGLALVNLVELIRRALGFFPPGSAVQLVQTGLFAMFAGDAASYVIAHQHFSGDPGMAVFAVMLGGMGIGYPIWVYMRQPPQPSNQAEVPDRPGRGRPPVQVLEPPPH